MKGKSGQQNKTMRQRRLPGLCGVDNTILMAHVDSKAVDSIKI